MNLNATTIAQLPRVEADLHYLVPMSEKPHSYNYEPPANVPRTNASHEARRVSIHNIRPIASAFSLDVQGAALLEHRSEVRNFYDDDEVKEVYYDEIARLIASVSGASRVEVFDHTVRRRPEAGMQGIAPRQPVPRVHNDYTLKSAPQRIRDLFPDEAERLLQRRFAIINAWRPIRGPLRDAPLAVLDARSVAPSDLVAADLIYPDRVGETYAVTFSPLHRWYYAPAMQRSEVLLIKGYDSESSRARFTPHAAFDDPEVIGEVLPRESIELRALAFF